VFVECAEPAVMRPKPKGETMGKYLFTYHGGSGMPETEQEQAKVMAAWGAWFEARGASFTDMGAPTSIVKTVSAAGVTDGADNQVTGYGIVQAADMDAACEIAGGCPVLDDGGSIQVSETFEISM